MSIQQLTTTPFYISRYNRPKSAEKKLGITPGRRVRARNTVASQSTVTSESETDDNNNDMVTNNVRTKSPLHTYASNRWGIYIRKQAKFNTVYLYVSPDSWEAKKR